MKVEIWSDIMCPFCYIGKRRLEAALKNFDHADKVQIEWKSFLLNPDMQTDPNKSTVEYLAETKGWSLEQTRQITLQVSEMAEGEGLYYQMDKTVVANARNAHNILQLAKSLGKGDQMKERLLKAYFTEGANIDNRETLFGFAEEVGIDRVRAMECLNTAEFMDKVNKDIEESRLLGVRGVPFFVFDRKFAISGAQSLEVFEKTLERAWADYLKEHPILDIAGSDTAACDVEGNCN
ncbi:DsbA family protein [Cecembia rubra]|uniref:Putative DsbA family dithiol-disulfide isomerase n=1 Tax=Cecembia rubra TaxID=1485585 RepID=A0A2P8DYI4_9BACT|nr:DsbA family oxidoreductase [Cecembia rubra]PSL02286.1 putative DsbA family dithiol-disulfide isomerase [Cecembia rubra]